MTSTIQCFLELLSSYINKTHFKSLYDNIDWKEVISLAKMHSVEGILNAVCYENAVVLPSEDMNKLHKAFLQTVRYSVKQDNELKTLINLFAENKISHLLTKGVIVKDIYPDRDLRTMGDIDILIKKEDEDKAIDILTHNGYEVVGSHLKEISFEKNSVHIEIHISLMDENPETGFNYINYYNNAFERAIQTRSYTYELNVSDHLIYLLVHIAKHFYNEGCGIRMIMDIAVYCKRLKDKIDWQYLLKEVETIKLKKFVFNVFYLCERYFDTKFDFDIPQMSNELYEKLTDYIIAGGTYGFNRENIGNKAIRKYKGIRMLRYVFPNTSEMRELCFWFRNKPSLLLPVAWVIRITTALANGKGKAMRKTKKQTVNENRKLLKELGIYK